MHMRRLRLLLSLLLLAAAPPADDRAREREMMVLSIANLAATAEPGKSRRIDGRILDAMREVPRHLLVPPDMRAHAYGNTALEIGHEATISQPYIVALMTQLLEPSSDDVVLEVGTGSGYQAAILSKLARRVHSIEIVEALAERAASDLSALGYRNVEVKLGDGYAGWPEKAPFDRIIVTAAVGHVPKPLLDQLKPGGIMVIPLGSSDNANLTVVRKNRQGRVTMRKALRVSFVPLKRSPG